LAPLEQRYLGLAASQLAVLPELYTAAHIVEQFTFMHGNVLDYFDTWYQSFSLLAVINEIQYTSVHLF
jgi:hypothetical protein